MDPKFWEELKKNTEAAVSESGEQGIRLVGGPMDGWLVLPDAPAFERDWWQTLPDWAKEPGYYELFPDSDAAQWRRLSDD